MLARFGLLRTAVRHNGLKAPSQSERLFEHAIKTFVASGLYANHHRVMRGQHRYLNPRTSAGFVQYWAFARKRCRSRLPLISWLIEQHPTAFDAVLTDSPIVSTSIINICAVISLVRDDYWRLRSEYLQKLTSVVGRKARFQTPLSIVFAPGKLTRLLVGTYSSLSQEMLRLGIIGHASAFAWC